MGKISYMELDSMV